jgi:predicted ATPase
VLIGRSEEQQVLAGVLRSLRVGHRAVTVVTGEAGIGKTALPEWMAETAGDMQVIRATGVQQETEFSFGGLHQILRPLPLHAGSLPAPQRQALQVALTLEDGPPPDRFLVYLSALTLIASAALDRPLLVVVDDVQWLDQQSRETLAFAAQRVLADPVALVFGLRAEQVSTELDGLPVLELHGLSPESAHELLLSVVSAHRNLDYAVARRIVAEADGNPLAVQELAAELIDGSLTAAAPLAPLPLTSRLESRFLRLARELPAGPQTLLLAARRARGQAGGRRGCHDRGSPAGRGGHPARLRV